MSLLMDALKRAEEAKRQQGDTGAPETGSLQLEPVSAPASESRNSGLPDLNSHLDAVDADLKATAAEPPPRQSAAGRKADDSIDRAVAQNVLAAGSAGTSEDSAGSSRNRIFAILGVGALAAAGVGTYFYLQLQGLSQGSNRLAAGPAGQQVRPPAPMAAMTPPPAPTPITAGESAPLATAQPAVTAVAMSSVPSSAPADTAGPSARQAAAVSVTRKAGSPKPAAATKTSTARPLAAGAKPTGSQTAVGNTVQVSRQSNVSPVIQGYESLQAGRFDDARAAYAQALRQDPRDVDAMIGLAAVAQKEGRFDDAADHYERALQIDPRNGTAVAGLSALQGGADTAQTESRLKSLINSQNSDANATSALNFALGNLYAGQRRWSEAQQAYFRAHSADAGNPDVLYNLAVSLEHLNQKPLARQFYGQAIQASRQRSANFDRAGAEKRLAALSAQ